ncbi:sugar ABC transporter permease [Microbacterium sp.]|uniref:carbohydrate ABC transporter permease n=1 Tax=Microbacterium sp. TaxID=51671 RepID=UPI0028125A7A|nr:sugar ABC transporter permease [Microbacterium sp.]
MTGHSELAPGRVDPRGTEGEVDLPGPRRRRRRAPAGLLFVAPALVLIGFFVVYPLVRLAYLAFTEYDGLQPEQWVGFANYADLLAWEQFHRFLLNTTLLLLGIPVWIVVPFTLAVAMFGVRGSGPARAVLLLPALLPPVVVGSVFRIILADNGPLNALLRSIGLDVLAPAWLSDPSVVLMTVVLVIAWGVTGMGVMFYSAGLSTMDEEVVEAAILDGATWRQLVWHVYRPALRPVTRFWMLLLVLLTVTSFFPWIFSLTKGGPGGTSTTVDYAIYQSGLVNNDLGRAAAISVVGILFVALVLAVIRAARRLSGADR